MKENLRIGLCQMNVAVGDPRRNAEYIVSEIKEAARRGIEILAFPEMCVPGYMIGDQFENESFVRDVLFQNERIREATKGLNIVVVFGSLDVENGAKGEDGRLRKYNAAFIAQNGQWLGRSIKTLQPNYRFFDDDRHFFSQRKNQEHDLHALEELIEPVFISGLGKIGVILCEDMWCDDYPYNPAKILADKGAEIIINLSASPWTWQKNDKRHRVVKRLLQQCNVPLVYVNNTGAQNTGKNVVVLDGSSAVYSAKGDIVFEAMPYTGGIFEIDFSEDMPPALKRKREDVVELFYALICGIRKSVPMLTGDYRKIVIGLSGGIDSAVVAALMVHALGKDRVHAINMPSVYSSLETKKLAERIAYNLGITYEVITIGGIVQSIAAAANIRPDTLAYENVQARARMEILAAKAQELGGVFTGNGNKVELGFNYGTLYGDIAGFLLPIGDLVKREVYQIGDYANQLFGFKAIPEECFKMTPTAELKDNQKDPFDYGNLDGRGYHDELVRAFTEFRRDPEWILEKYLDRTLESEFQLEPGRLAFLYSLPDVFIRDLEKNWKSYYRAIFKRNQAPPVIVVSKRAFGTDMRESILPPYFTERYEALKAKILQPSQVNVLF